MLPIAALALGGALFKAYQKNEENKETAAMNMAAAEQTRMSPWTKSGPGVIQRQGSVLGSAVDGAIAGASFGQQFGSTAPTGGGMTGGNVASTSYLGGDSMANQLGSYGQGFGTQAPTMYSSSPYLSDSMFAKNSYSPRR